MKLINFYKIKSWFCFVSYKVLKNCFLDEIMKQIETNLRQMETLFVVCGKLIKYKNPIFILYFGGVNVTLQKN